MPWHFLDILVEVYAWRSRECFWSQAHDMGETQMILPEKGGERKFKTLSKGFIWYLWNSKKLDTSILQQRHLIKHKQHSLNKYSKHCCLGKSSNSNSLEDQICNMFLDSLGNELWCLYQNWNWSWHSITCLSLNIPLTLNKFTGSSVCTMIIFLFQLLQRYLLIGPWIKMVLHPSTLNNSC